MWVFRFGMVILVLLLSTVAIARYKPPSRPMRQGTNASALSKREFAIFDASLKALAKRRWWDKRPTLLSEEASDPQNVLADLDMLQVRINSRAQLLSSAFVLEAKKQAGKTASLSSYKPPVPLGKISLQEQKRYHTRQTEIFNSRGRNASADHLSAVGKYATFRTIITLSVPAYHQNHKEALVVADIDPYGGFGGESVLIALKRERNVWKVMWMDTSRYAF